MTLIAPHGGTLVNRMSSSAVDEVSALKKIQVDEIALSDIRQIGMGAFSPLTGFMDEADYREVIANMRLKNGLLWSLPVVLPVTQDSAARTAVGEQLALCDRHDVAHAILTVTSIYRPNLPADVKQIYGTDDTEHPGVYVTLQRGDVYLGGSITVLPAAENEPFSEYAHTPEQARSYFEQRGWKTIVGFQTRNPIHRAHEYIQKCALEIVDGLYIHPLVGPTKDDDVPAELRMRAYHAVIHHYYPQGRVLLGAYTAAMRYAGPREAILHALVRKNFGCTHFIVGRDHAGVGNYYGTYEAQHIFHSFSVDEIGIIPLFFEHAFYCTACAGMSTTKTCPHGEQTRVILSGTKVRSMLVQGIAPPPEFSRPEVVSVLMEFYEKFATQV
ncbi:MAG: sulfate adenylyltransferase [Bacilli bacterium]